MIAADTSSLSAYFKGEAGNDIDRIEVAFLNGEMILPPVVITELLSDPSPAKVLAPILSRFEILEIAAGYWHRAGEMRRKVRLFGYKAKTADALIAQSCIDNGVALITRDPDFRHFARHCGLILA